MKEEEKEKDPIYSKKVVEFITVANEYCLFIEKAENYLREDIIQYMLKICPLLYLKGALLPESKENDFEIPERFVNEEQWESIYKAVNEKLGKDDVYFHITNKETGENVPSMASISDNLADVYQDMKDFIMLYSKGTHAAKENAVAECRHLFETHWGIKIINAHRALHNITYKENVEENFFENEN